MAQGYQAERKKGEPGATGGIARVPSPKRRCKISDAMASNALNLPFQLKQEAEEWANRQGVSLDQFIVWAVAEKVGGLKQAVDDPRFPLVAYRRGAAGWPEPVLRGTGIRVQTLVVAHQIWSMDPSEIAADYDLTVEQVTDALAFYDAHRGEIEAALADEQASERVNA
jgi:uncharacterized protein (DUF433 family)